MDYFEEQLRLLELERQYDQKQHEGLLLQSSLQERKSLGVTWFPIVIQAHELGRGDYLTVTIQRTNDVEVGHRFRFGMPVALFSNHAPQEDRLSGLIAFVSREVMRISFRVDELPDWCRRGKLGVDLLFDENTYKEMRQALIQAQGRCREERHGGLVRQLIGEETSSSIGQSPTLPEYMDPRLNESQCLAVRHMLSSVPLSIIHGPPGTGKTTTLIHGIRALLAQDSRQLLLVAPSNTAVDLLTERLDAIGVSVVRIGNAVRVSEHLQQLTLDAQLDHHPANKEVKALEKQSRAYADMAHKYKRNFGKAERDQRKALLQEARKIRKEIDQIQDYIVEEVLAKAQVITATLVGANHHTLGDRRYHTVIIDEAAQALEPACWIPILKAQKLILAGDHQQLPPTVKSSTYSSEGLYHTLFEKLVARYPTAVSLLDVQYRMNDVIMKYPSQVLYGGRLQSDRLVCDWTLKGDEQPLAFIDTAGAGYEELVEDKAISNPEEATFVLQHFRQYYTDLVSQYEDGALPNVGIVTPYRAQSLLLRKLIEGDDVLMPYLNRIVVNTIDSFQGQEKDIIYISLTRSNADQQIGFLADIRRMNVAMTRAKTKLIVVGDSSTIGQHSFYKEFLAYIDTVNAYHSVWEYGVM